MRVGIAGERQRAAFLARQAQALGEALGILGHLDGQRGEAGHGVGGAVAAFDLDDAREQGRARRRRQHLGEDAVLVHAFEGRADAGRDEQPDELLADAFGGEHLEAGTLARAGEEAVRVVVAVGVLRGEAEEPEDAQVVLADALAGIADEAHAARHEIVEPAERIVDRAGGVAIERVDREVAASRVLRPIVGEGDGGVAAVGLHVAAQGRHLEGVVIGDHRHGAVLQAGLDDGEASGAGEPHHVLGRRGGGEVDVGDGNSHQRVAHHAADRARLEAAARDRGHHGLGRGRAQPGRIGETGQAIVGRHRGWSWNR